MSINDTKYFTCYKCNRLNPDWIAFGLSKNRSCCLYHIPLWTRITMRLKERFGR